MPNNTEGDGRAGGANTMNIAAPITIAARWPASVKVWLRIIV